MDDRRHTGSIQLLVVLAKEARHKLHGGKSPDGYTSRPLVRLNPVRALEFPHVNGSSLKLWGTPLSADTIAACKPEQCRYTGRENRDITRALYNILCDIQDSLSPSCSDTPKTIVGCKQLLKVGAIASTSTMQVQNNERTSCSPDTSERYRALVVMSLVVSSVRHHSKGWPQVDMLIVTPPLRRLQY